MSAKKSEKESKVTKPGKGKKVYSPDITSFSFEGNEGIAHIFAYVLVAPFRIVSRVMHNILILPANLQEQYARGLLIIGGFMTLLGAIDLIVFKKWVLLVSQLPVFIISHKMKQSAQYAIEQQAEEPIIDVDREEVNAMAESVYEELDKIL